MIDRTPEQIAADINDVRARMDSTLYALEHRLNVKRLVRDGLDHLRDTAAVRYAARTAVNAGRTAREHPYPTALACTGLLGLLVWGVRSGSRHDRITYELPDNARGRLLEARRALAETASEARRHSRETASRAWHGLEYVGREARSAVREHPIAASSIGVALVAIAALAALPAIRNRIGR